MFAVGSTQRSKSAEHPVENLEEHDSVEELLNEQQGDEFCSEEPAHKKPKKSEVKYTPKRCIRKLSGAHNLLIILEHALRTAPSSGKNKSSFLFPVDTATELLSLLEAADFAVEFLQANPAPSTAVPAAAPVPAPAAAPSEDPALKERIDKLNTEVQKLYTDKATIKKEAHFKIKEQEALIFQLQEKVSIADKVIVELSKGSLFDHFGIEIEKIYGHSVVQVETPSHSEYSVNITKRLLDSSDKVFEAGYLAAQLDTARKFVLTPKQELSFEKSPPPPPGLSASSAATVLPLKLPPRASSYSQEKKKLQEELLGLPTTGAFNALQREHSALQRENIALKSGFSEIEAVLRKVLPKPAVPKPASKPAAAPAKPGGYEPENREPCARSVPKP